MMLTQTTWACILCLAVAAAIILVSGMPVDWWEDRP